MFLLNAIHPRHELLAARKIHSWKGYKGLLFLRPILRRKVEIPFQDVGVHFLKGAVDLRFPPGMLSDCAEMQ